MELVRQSPDAETNGDLDQNDLKSVEDSPQHMNESNALLDLLGGSDGSDLDIIKPSQPSSQIIPSSNNQDLLDLLGGLDVSPTLPMSGEAPLGFISENNNPTIPLGNNQNSNFLTGDFLNTNNVNGEGIFFYK